MLGTRLWVLEFSNEPGNASGKPSICCGIGFDMPNCSDSTVPKIRWTATVNISTLVGGGIESMASNSIGDIREFIKSQIRSKVSCRLSRSIKSIRHFRCSAYRRLELRLTRRGELGLIQVGVQCRIHGNPFFRWRTVASSSLISELPLHELVDAELRHVLLLNARLVLVISRFRAEYITAAIALKIG